MKRQPPTALAEFNVIVVLADATGMLPGQRGARFVEVTFERGEAGQWRVIDFAHHDLARGLQRREPDATDGFPPAE